MSSGDWNEIPDREADYLQRGLFQHYKSQSQTHSVSPDQSKTIRWLSLSSRDRQEWKEFMRELSLTYGTMSQELSGARLALIKSSREIL